MERKHENKPQFIWKFSIHIKSWIFVVFISPSVLPMRLLLLLLMPPFLLHSITLISVLWHNGINQWNRRLIIVSHISLCVFVHTLYLMYLIVYFASIAYYICTLQCVLCCSQCCASVVHLHIRLTYQRIEMKIDR